MEKKVKLYQKLFNIQCNIKGLGKDKEGHGFEYVTPAKMLKAIRPQMDAEKLLLIPGVTKTTLTPVQYNNANGKLKKEILAQLDTTFTWVDVETGESLCIQWASMGFNGMDKGINSAHTYGERYFLMKFFHIQTDEDDMDDPNAKRYDDYDAETKSLIQIKVEKLQSLLRTKKMSNEELMKKFNLKSNDTMTEEQIDRAIEKLS